MVHYPILLSRKKWGSLGGKGPMEPGRPSGRRSIRARPPERVFGYFLHEQKVPRRKAKPCTPFLLALSKEMGSEKTFFKDAVLEMGKAI